MQWRQKLDRSAKRKIGDAILFEMRFGPEIYRCFLVLSNWKIVEIIELGKTLGANDQATYNIATAEEIAETSSN